MSQSPDYQQVLIDAISPKKTYKLSEVKDRLVKVAFDVVRFKDADPLKLWKIEAGEEGDYIVALYQDDDSSIEKSASASYNWATKVSGNSLNVFYKGMPVIKLASEEIGVPEEELSLVEAYLPEKLSTNASLRQSLLNKLPKGTKEVLFAQFPELTK
jgi:hypothetical protein